MNSMRRNSRQTADNLLISEIFLVLKGSIVAILISLVCFVIFAILMTLANLPESLIPPVNQVIRVLSIALGGAFAARSSGRKGWLKGAFTGFLYIIIAVLINVLFLGGSFPLNLELALDLGMGAIIGAAGGAIGINLK